MIRAQVRRDGPGEWSFTLSDERGEILTGLAGSQEQAYAQADAECRRLAAPPPLVAPAVVGRSWLTRLLLGGER